MKTFFICALPRSRTSWLANLLTYDQSFCFHEPLVGIKSLSELRSKFDSVNRCMVGSSDCGNQYFSDALSKEFPKSKFIVIRRPLEECQKEMIEIGHPDHGTLEHSDYLLSRVIVNHSPLVIDFYDLSKPETGMEIFDYLHIPFDRDRFDMLVNLDIQPMPEWINSQINADNLASANTLAGCA